MKNRVNLVLDAPAIADILKDITTLKSKMKALLVNASDEDRKGGGHMGDGGGVLFVERAYEIGKNNPGIYPGWYKFEEFTRDYEHYKSIIPFDREFMQIYAQLTGTKILVGKDLMDHANYTRTMLESAMNNDPSLKSLYEELNFLYENRTRRKEETQALNKELDELKLKLAAAEQNGDNSTPPPVIEQSTGEVKK